MGPPTQHPRTPDGTQDAPGYYVWYLPGRPVTVYLPLPVVDQISIEVIRGFGAVPKRGAEVGGLLLGTIEPSADGGPAAVRIQDFQPVPCEYRRGPSYIFTEEDGAALEDAWQRWQPSASPSNYAVGYFRSHTRDGLGLSPEDIELLDSFFPGPAHVALLVKPFTTKPSIAGFFCREDGAFPETSPLEFPFRRQELSGEEAPRRRPLEERRARSAAAQADRADSGLLAPSPAPPASPAAKPHSTGGWVWLVLSFLFLVLGAALGFQAASSIGSRTPVSPVPSLALAVATTDGSLNVTWDRQSPVIRAALRGVLEIQDGRTTKPVDLDPTQLRNGALIYRNSSNSVRLRLTVYPSSRLSVTETLDWKR